MLVEKVITDINIFFNNYLIHRNKLSSKKTKLDSAAQSDSLPKEKKNFVEKYFYDQLREYDSSKIVLNVFSQMHDNFYSIQKLVMLYKINHEHFSDLSLSNEFLEFKKSRNLLLLTSKEYYINQPNYDLGIVGKYLKMSKTLTALILAIISL